MKLGIVIYESGSSSDSIHFLPQNEREKLSSSHEKNTDNNKSDLICKHREIDKASNGSDQIAFVYFDLGNILYSFNTEKVIRMLRCDVT